MNAVVPLQYQDMERMANALAKSGLFGIKDPTAAMALMAVAQAEGKHPASVAQDYDIIQGRAAKKSQAMLRDFIAAGGSVKWHELSDKLADATFSHPQGGTVRIGWDMARAQQAGLAEKSTWRQYPRAMLRSRCVSEGVRTVAPMATGGMYTPEEVVDMGPEEIDVTPAPTPVLTEEIIGDHVRAMKQAGDLVELKRAYATAYSAAKMAGDLGALEQFEMVKDHRKAALEAPIEAER